MRRRRVTASFKGVLARKVAILFFNETTLPQALEKPGMTFHHFWDKIGDI
jgi:hypothetical protein